MVPILHQRWIKCQGYFENDDVLNFDNHISAAETSYETMRDHLSFLLPHMEPKNKVKDYTHREFIFVCLKLSRYFKSSVFHQ